MTSVKMKQLPTLPYIHVYTYSLQNYVSTEKTTDKLLLYMNIEAWVTQGMKGTESSVMDVSGGGKREEGRK